MVVKDVEREDIEFISKASGVGGLGSWYGSVVLCTSPAAPGHRVHLQGETGCLGLAHGREARSAVCHVRALQHERIQRTSQGVCERPPWLRVGARACPAASPLPYARIPASPAALHRLHPALPAIPTRLWTTAPLASCHTWLSSACFPLLPHSTAAMLPASQTLHCLPIAHVDHMRPEKLGQAALVEEVDVS